MKTVCNPKRPSGTSGLVALVFLLSFLMGLSPVLRLLPGRQERGHFMERHRRNVSSFPGHHFRKGVQTAENFFADAQVAEEAQEDGGSAALLPVSDVPFRIQPACRLLSGDSSPPLERADVAGVPLFVLHHSWRSFLC